MKRGFVWLICICLLLTGCTAWGEEQTGLVQVEYKKADLDASWSEEDAVPITFGGAQADIGGPGAYLIGNALLISAEGDYLLSGEFDGRIVVDAGKKDKVRLILNGLTVRTEDSTALFILKADKATVTLADGSENTLIAGSRLLIEDDEELDAALYSKADLVINGGGRLNVDAPSGNGILSKDDLRLIGGGITVNAAADGVRGRDAIQMYGGEVSVTAGGDGMKSNNDEDTERGYISIDGGTAHISAGEDGMQAETALQVLGGEVNIVNSYEGMEAQYMLIAGGTVRVTSVEDGLNAAGGDSALQSRNPFHAGHQSLEIAGGTVYINASGDGIDSNGAMRFSGGETYVSGPVDNGNAALDASGDMTVSGGIVLAAGSSGMASAPSADGQAATLVLLQAAQPGGARISIRDGEGKEIAAFTPEKAFDSLAVSVPGLEAGESFGVYAADALIAEGIAGESARAGRGGHRK